MILLFVSYDEIGFLLFNLYTYSYLYKRLSTSLGSLLLMESVLLGRILYVLLWIDSFIHDDKIKQNMQSYSAVQPIHVENVNVRIFSLMTI